MRIANSQSPTFQAIHVQGSMMTPAQRNAVEKIVDIISYSDQYMKAKESNLDLCFIAAKDKLVEVMFLDRDSESFVKTAANEILKVTSKTANKINDVANRILKKLEETLSGKYVIEEFNAEKLALGDTEADKFFEALAPEDIDAKDLFCIAYRV